MNFHGLRYVSERCELGEQREALLAVTIPEEKAASSNSANCLAGDRSPSSTTVLPMPKRLHLCRRAPEPRPRRAQRNFADAQRRRLQRGGSPTTKWRSCMCAIWSAGVRHIRCRNASTASNSRNHRARCCASSTRWVRTGTFLCSTIAAMAPTTGAYWRRSNLATMNRISKPG